ncbi:glycoside hydrolase family 43 protein [Bifidobacterium olomucense]|uniref:Beta-xylosidase n=1 Tax=Bifidobacterium olomucense TaxID=2675324 RepID=A0A7Y0HUL9_9BIFI|nr:glycoside hydrolase family 43 protein [Bifidobacterium sp. DSM 109959]NMM97320.1 beta-xylosidase [Bifidobacterium sp. DSM 109959]
MNNTNNAIVDMVTHTHTVANPVMRGMYPDPSWMWDETRNEIVLVNSSFELIPGLPIHVTRDLVSWEHVADAVNAAMAKRLLIEGVEDSGGLYAPTIRRIRGQYVIVCTVARVNEERALACGCAPEDIEGRRASQGNFVITAPSLEGPWQGPYWIAGAEGIDPDIFEDSDGTVWWTQTRPALKPQWEGQTEVWTQPIDPTDWMLQGCKTVIWRGYGVNAVWAEGPHLYRVGDWVYLMTAEGGTSFEHSEMMMRTYAPQGFAAALAVFERNIVARDVWIEPAREDEHSVVGRYDRLFEACKKNPVLTHRHLGNSELIQCVGHADLLCHPQAGWLLTCLGVREVPCDEPDELFSYLGRETFIAPVVWERNPVSWKLESEGPIKQDNDNDPGWPVVAPGLGHLPEALDIIADDDGELRSVEIAEYTEMNAEPEMIRYDDNRLIGVRGRDGYRFIRVDEPNYTVLAAPSYALMLHQDSTHAVTLRVQDSRVNVEITDRGEIAHLELDVVAPDEWLGVHLFDNRMQFLAMRHAAGADGFSGDAVLIVHGDSTQARVLGERDARFLSTEWAGGFVGCLAGVECQ